MKGRITRGKNFKKITFSRTGNYVMHAGGNAKQRTENERVPTLQRVIKRKRKRLGI